MSTPQFTHKSKNHQLNYEGCRCHICQRVSLNENNRIVVERYNDHESESYHPHHHKEAYLQLIDQFIIWEKYPRKLRFSLPEICVFYNGFPQYWITKNKDNTPTKVIRSKSKMNMFEIQHFFLEGFLLHHPEVVNKKKQKEGFKENARKQCIVAAKYNKNITQLLTLDQIQNLFKSKYKYMRDGLMFLQTLVGAHHSQEVIIKIDLENIQDHHKDLYDRAKHEAKMFVNEIKITDIEYYQQKAEIQFQRELKQNVKKFLTYLSLKIIFIASKMKSSISSEAVFKWAFVNSTSQYFLWDFRIQKEVSNAPYWQNSVMQALEYKLKKTMSMMELQPENQVAVEKISAKAKQFSKWLEESTSNQWNQMKIIRTRLEKLQSQKKALIQSQKNSLEAATINKTFRFRNVRKRSTAHSSFNHDF